jgi:cytochrome c553
MAMAAEAQAYNQCMTHSLMRHARTLRCLAGALLAFGVAAGAARATTPNVPDTLQQRIAACTTCHGVHGEGRPGSKFFPRLAGKPAAYLARQMRDFQVGLRRYAPMEYAVRHLTPDYMREIADYFAAQEVAYAPSPAPAVSAAVLRRGETLVTHGDAQLRVPACAACHGTDLVGVEPSTPALVGLPYDYISSQLGSWRTHTRATVQPDCMALIASRLRESDISAVAAWLASRQMPAQTRPQAAGSVHPPLECGVLRTPGEGA